MWRIIILVFNVYDVATIGVTYEINTWDSVHRFDIFGNSIKCGQIIKKKWLKYHSECNKE